ncbi:helix-turn-helix transcriptional regulator [Bacillus gobiensis]|uniref:helix-turn-helix domain-containing protein n=1 Tax=Bacillus gobiensis TaxID=1441095 RepID=UPI003D22655C
MHITHDIFRFIRQNNRLSQRNMATRLGISHSYVSAIEVGARPVSRRISDKVVDEFGITQQYIDIARQFMGATRRRRR